MQNNNNFAHNNNSFIPAIVYNNADTDKLRILSDNKDKAPAEEPQALREDPGAPSRSWYLPMDT
jgi:hypothetical protein